MLHAEVEEHEIEIGHAVELHFLLLQVRREAPFRHREVDEFRRRALDHVVLGVEEGEPARLRLLDDIDLDALDHRQALAAQSCGDRLLHGIVGRRLLLVVLLAVVRIALEHHARGALPLREAVGAGADRLLHRAIRIGLDHLARHRAAEVAVGEVVQHVRHRLVEHDAQRVAVDGAQAFHVAVVVELAAGEGGLAHRVHADDELVEEIEIRRLALRVEVALHRVDVILRDELALLALERRVVGEVDAGADAHGPGLAVGGDFRQPLGRVRLRLRGPRQVVVVERRIEHVRDDDARVDVVDLHRVEAGLGDQERVAQHLLGHRGRRDQDAG